MADDVVTKEYFALLDTVKSYDERLMTVKGWGVTLSLASLGFGFQYGHYGLFLVAALNGLSFWALEAILKEFQMHYYVRMREIEVQQADVATKSGQQFATPQIDWGWQTASRYFTGKWKQAEPPKPPERYGRKLGMRFPFILPQVWLPHAISIIVGGTLFGLGIAGLLPLHL